MAWKSLLLSGLNFPSCRHSLVRLSVRRNFQAVTFYPALVCRETASAVPMSCRADGHRRRGKKASHLSCGSSADHRRRTGEPASAGGRELVVVRHADYCRSGNSRADKWVRRGRMPGSTFLSSEVGVLGWLVVCCLSTTVFCRTAKP